MISGSVVCTSFKTDLLSGVHNFLTDQFQMALYSADANISADTTAYVTDGEISGQGYTAGGRTLVNPQILSEARTAYATFDDPVWTASAIMARGALIYNQSKGQRAVAVLDFTSDKISNQGNFRVKLPPPAPSTALIRIA